MQLDIISDTICPWCYIGKRRLDRALAQRPDISVRIFWRAFQLDPTIPRGGLERQSYLKRRFGPESDQGATSKAVVEAGLSEGIAFAFDKMLRIPNTFDSHRLIHFATQGDQQNAVVDLLFKRYFEDGADIGDPAELTDIAAAAGLDPAQIDAMLKGDRGVGDVEAEIANAHTLGINGVPCFLINSRYALIGAQETETLISVFDRVTALTTTDA